MNRVSMLVLVFWQIRGLVKTSPQGISLLANGSREVVQPVPKTQPTPALLTQVFMLPCLLIFLILSTLVSNCMYLFALLHYSVCLFCFLKFFPLI